MGAEVKKGDCRRRRRLENGPPEFFPDGHEIDFQAIRNARAIGFGYGKRIMFLFAPDAPGRKYFVFIGQISRLPGAIERLVRGDFAPFDDLDMNRAPDRSKKVEPSRATMPPVLKKRDYSSWRPVYVPPPRSKTWVPASNYSDSPLRYGHQAPALEPGNIDRPWTLRQEFLYRARGARA